jgi:hypothetical protein
VTLGVRTVGAGALALALALGTGATARADFRLVATWGSAGGGSGQFVSPSGVASNGAGTIYGADVAAGRVVLLDDDSGAFVSAFGAPGAGPGQLAGPTHVAADAFGSVYVIDRDNARVQKFTAEGGFLQTWGSRGGGDGQFLEPTGVATDSRGNVYVADRQTNRIQRFTSDGAFDLAWGGTGTGAGQFSAAQDVAVDVFGDVYVVDAGANRVEKFTAVGAPLFGWGSAGSGDGQFNGPSGIATDGAGQVYVADAGNQRVQQFNPDGAFITHFGGGGPGQLANPVDVASDSSGAAYVVDQGTARILKFAEPDPPLLPPKAGRTANIKRVSGIVLVRRAGTARFTRVRRPQQIPMGSQVQTTHGKATLITASNLTGGQQAANFYGGLFTISQHRAPRPVTELTLGGGHFGVCSKRASRRGKQGAAAKRKHSDKVVRRLWGNGKGHFRTKGNHASAGVRGTIWLTEDRCDGTLVRVRRGTVRVRDFVRARTVLVRTGQSYLARRR